MPVLTRDLLAHLAAVRDGEPDDADLGSLADHLRESGDEDRADLIQVQVELGIIGKPKGWGCRKCTSPAVINPTYSTDECGCRTKPLVSRESALLARNPAWLAVPCPECGGLEGNSHDRCNGTGELLANAKPTLARGFVTVTLPSALCWRECQGCHGVGGRYGELAMDLANNTVCRKCRGEKTVPHPVLAAVFDSPVGPWVRRVVVSDRVPDNSVCHAGGRTHDWYDASQVRAWEDARLPKPVFDWVRRLGGVSNLPTDGYVEFPTAEAATDALARAVPLWGRDF